MNSKLKKLNIAGAILILITGGVYFFKKNKSESQSAAVTAGTVEETPLAEQKCVSNPSDYHFLKGSKILKEAGIQVKIAEVTETEVIFPTTCTPLMGPFFSLGSEGPVVLTGVSTQHNKNLEWGCGEIIPAAAYKTENPLPSKFAPFLFEGKTEGISISWKPAFKQAIEYDCGNRDEKFKLESAQIFSVEGVSGNIAIEYLSKTSAAVSSEDCPTDSYVYKIIHLTSEKECSPWIVSTLDCDHMPTERNFNFESVYGLLEVKKENQLEQWLIFESRGYEGNGISAFPLRPDHTIHIKDAEHIVYNGC